jgi:NitT/TauT family transport system permease protein
MTAGSVKTRRGGRGLYLGIGSWLAFVAVVVVVWQAAVTVFGIATYLIPGPLDVAATVITRSDTLSHATGTTFLEAAAGFLLGNVVAIIAAIVVASSVSAARIVLPIALGLRSTPIIAVTPFLTLLFGYTLTTAAVIVGLIVFFPTVVNGVLGFRSASPEWLDYMHVIDASPSQVLRYVRIPAAMPPLFTAFRIGAASAILGAMVAEWVTTGTGLGHMIFIAGIHFDASLAWAGILVATVATFAAISVIALVEKMVAPWAQEPAL